MSVMISYGLQFNFLWEFPANPWSALEILRESFRDHEKRRAPAPPGGRDNFRTPKNLEHFFCEENEQKPFRLGGNISDFLLLERVIAREKMFTTRPIFGNKNIISLIFFREHCSVKSPLKVTGCKFEILLLRPPRPKEILYFLHFHHRFLIFFIHLLNFPRLTFCLTLI